MKKVRDIIVEHTLNLQLDLTDYYLSEEHDLELTIPNNLFDILCYEMDGEVKTSEVSDAKPVVIPLGFEDETSVAKLVAIKPMTHITFHGQTGNLTVKPQTKPVEYEMHADGVKIKS